MAVISFDAPASVVLIKLEGELRENMGDAL